jgi:hypothetical protein
VADMLQPDESGLVPYADVAFDVGPDSGGSATGRFLAHRIIVASESKVLMEELSKLPMTLLPREQIQAAVFRVDPRISKEVWRSVLQFMYTGVVNFSASSDVHKVVELLRACVAYQLPQPLLDFAQSCLYPLLPSSSPEVALQVFSICAGAAASDVDLSAAREGSTYILLRSAHKLFEETDAREACQILEKVVQSVEKSVFKPKAQSAQQQDIATNQQGMQMPQAAGMDMMAQSMGGYMYGSPDMMQQSMRGAPHNMMMQTMHGAPEMMQTLRGSPEMMQTMNGYQDMMSQSRQMSPDMMAQTVQGTSDMMMQTTQGLPEMMQSMRGSPEMMQTMSGYPDMMSQSRRMSPEMMSQDMMAQSMRGQQDMLMQSTRTGQDMASQRMRSPEDMVAMMQDPRMQMMQDPRLQMMQSSGQGYPQMEMSYSQGMPAQMTPQQQQQLMQSQMYAMQQAAGQQGGLMPTYG